MSQLPQRLVYVIDGADVLQRVYTELLPRVLKASRGLHDVNVRVKLFDSIEAFIGTQSIVDPAPHVLIMSNRLSLSGIEQAGHFRRDGYRGKIFIFTGQWPLPEKTPDVDGVFEKARDHQQLLEAVREALI